MAKFYSENSSKNRNNLEPRKETINFILKYSKALRVINYNNLKFEALLN